VSGSSPSDEPTDVSSWIAGRGNRIEALGEYFFAHGDRFTPEALRRAAADAGFSPEEIEAAADRATARQRTDDVARPLRRQARWIVIGAYGIVWVLFAAVYLTQPVLYNAGLFFQGVLTVALLIALALSLAWLRRRRPDPGNAWRAMVVFLVVPVILLIGIAGLCLPYTKAV
jgi:hypothetical protein